MKKVMRLLTSAAALALVAAASLYGCALREFGQAPEDVSPYKNLAYFSGKEFVSPEPLTRYPERVRGGSIGWSRFLLPNPNAPIDPLPSVPLHRASFAKTPETLAAYWLGHSSLILEIEGKRLVIDPVFGNAAPLPFIVRRYGAPPLARDELPPLDYVLITHDHYDHLEYATMRYLKDTDARFIVPLGVGAHLRSWGIPAEKIHELGWGDEWADNGLRIAAERTIHYSGRTFGTRNRSLWACYAIKGRTKRVFVSGDTGYGAHFADIGQKHGPFDVAFIEIDGWNPGWPKTHLFPGEVVKAYRDVKAKAMVPVHWGVFDLAIHPWDESIKMLAEIADREKGIDLLTPRMGEKLLPGIGKTSRWWENLR